MPRPSLPKDKLLAMLAIVATLLLTLHFYRPPEGGRWLQVFYDSLHVPVFGTIAASIYLLWPATDSRWLFRAAAAFGIAAALGVLSELAQINTARDASVGDFIADCLGASGFIAAILAIWPPRTFARTHRLLAGITAVVLLGWSLAPLAKVTAAYAERDSLFPAIYQPEAHFSRELIRLQHVHYERVTDSGAERAHASISFSAAPWPGVALHDLYPDWSGHTSLVIDLFVEGDDDLTLNLRVHDREHAQIKKFSDRFNRTFELSPGHHTLVVAISDIENAPRGRTMDLSRVSELILFGEERDPGRTIRLYSIRLE